MNCEQALRLLYDILDREASEVDVEEVKKHLEHCRDCAHVYQVEGMLNDFIRAKVSEQKSTPHLETLKSKIVASLDTVDSGKGSGGSQRPFRIPALAIAAAASLVFFIGVAFMASNLFRDQVVYTPLEQAHLAITADIDRFTAPNAHVDGLSLISAGMNYTVQPEVHGYHLAEASVDTIQGIAMDHLIYCNGNNVISVFVVPTAHFTLPDDVQELQVQIENVTLFNQPCKGCRVMYQVTGPVTVITATKCAKVKLEEFIPGYTLI
jgi:anti-sigma factor (TIGR02949 family)